MLFKIKSFINYAQIKSFLIIIFLLHLHLL